MAARLLPYLLLALLGADDCAAAPPLTGAWTLNRHGSTDADKAFEDKLRRDAYPVPQMLRQSERPNSRDLTQMAYWETVRDGNERNSSKNLRRLGTAYPLVKATHLDISEEDGGYRINYDGDIPRLIRPNSGGRVFSAKGNELVEDTFGFTLAYWDKDTLVLEADAPDGGTVTERLTIRENPHQLEYVVKVNLRIMKEPVEVTRVFDPAAAHPSP